MGCHKAGKMVKEEALSALCRMGKAYGRFSGNQRSVQETEHPGIDA